MVKNIIIGVLIVILIVVSGLYVIPLSDLNQLQEKEIKHQAQIIFQKQHQIEQLEYLVQEYEDIAKEIIESF
jgi:flagellar basal body-associated protein FliL